MAAFANANTKRYSWWWDSHISPKNSKWLQENLTDMDSKVKQMIKVIEEDADSFARRAEMYYKKRPELMKLVEEFYRAYRALAERYDHATGVIRHAQQTMAEAFPNQDPMMFGEESLVGSSTTEEFDPQTPESYPPIRAPVYPSDLQNGALGISSSRMSTVKRNIAFMEDTQSNGKGLKIGKARKGLNFNDFDGNGRNAKVLSESERASKAEAEIVALKDALAKVQADKEANLAQFDQNLERLSNMESEVSRAQEDSRCSNEKATRAEAEVETLRETLSKLEVEKESSLLQYQQCLENIADLEERISLAQKEAGEVNERASQAEAEIIALKKSLVGSETDKEAALVQYQHCLETISNLEERLRKAEEDVRLMNQRAENADGEVESLKEKVSKLTQENEAYELQYQQCLEQIADLKLKLFHAQEETQRLSREIEDGVAKLKFAEEKCVVLERSNQNLHSELDGLLEKLGNQIHELTEKQKEMGKLWTTVQEEHLRFTEAETAFQTLQQLHSQSQEELNTLALELQNRSQILKDMEARNNGLQEEVQEAKDESKSLNELNLASAASIKSLQEEVSRLRERIQKLEAEVELRVDQRNALQQEIYCLKEELSQIGKKHQSMVEQVELIGLHPEGFGSSIKELQEENSMLKEIKERESIEKTTLLEKLELMEKLVQKNLLLENSISDLNSELETVRGKLKTLEEACMSLAEEKSGLYSEKDMLISRLQSAAENSKKLSEENRLLENSLFDANAELEELKSKLRSLEDSCHMLNDDKSSLVNERESLLSDIDVMRKGIEDLEKEQAELKVKVLELATERESCLQKIQELGVSLDAKDRDYASFVHLSESQKSKIHHLQDENQRQEREYQKELDRAHDAQVEIIVLQKCLQEWLEKSSSLVAENQNLKQAAHLLEKLVSELEQENIGKQVQIDSSINCIKALRTGIHQVLLKLDVIPGIDSGDENSQDQKSMHEILNRLDEMQAMLLKIQNENQQSTIENLVLVEFIRQLKSEAVGIATGKKILEKENESQRSQLLLLQDEIQKLINMNGVLTTKVNEGVDREEILKVEIEDMHRQSAIENLVLVEFLHQLKSEAVGIATEKKSLEEELESHRDEAKNLSHMIEELTTKVDQVVDREAVLKEEIEDLHRQSAIENLFLVEFVHQLKSEAAGIATEKKILEEELESKSYLLSLSLDETKKLSYMIGQLTTKVNQGVSREEVLKVEVDDVHMQSAVENLVLVEFLHQLKSEALGIATEKKSLEEELESQRSLSRDETKKLSYMIGELTTKVNQGVSREEVLKAEIEDLHKQSAIENLVLVQFLQQLKSDALGIAAEKKNLEEELESHRSLSRDEVKNLSHMIEKLTTKVDQGVDREAVLKVEIEDMNRQSAIENLVRVQFLRQLKSELVGIATEKETLKEELESQRYQLLFSQDETKKLSHMIEELTTKVNQGVNREEVLKVEVDDVHMQSAIENLVLVESLRQLQSEAVCIATEKKNLEEELESQCYQLSSLQDETKNLIYMIGELTTKVNQGVNREEVLKVENEDVYMQSAIKNLVLVESLRQLKSEAVCIATEKKILEEELESQRSKLSLSRDETQKLIYMNGELSTKVNQGVNREEVLNVKLEDLHRQVLQLRNDYATLQGENDKTLDEKRYLTNLTLRLEEERRKLEEDISLLLSETIYQSNLIILLEDVVLEKLSEAVKLNEDLDRLCFAKCKLEEEVREVGAKLKSSETESLQLEGLLEKTDAELLSARSANDHLEHEIANVKDQLVQKEKELLEAMLVISIVRNEKSELSKAVEDLEGKYNETKAIEEDKDKQVLKLRGDYEEQVKKTGHVNEVNLKLEADMLNLLMELEGIKADKEKLIQDLSKEKNEVEQWESQASTLFGDLQVSVVHETFLKGLTHELAEAYSNLENSCTLKDVEIDQLNQKLSKEKNEAELWESQASTLFGDLQILAVHKTLLEGLVHELAEAYNNLDKRSTYKDVEIDQLKERVNNLEDANKGQEDLMSKYFQAIILLKESIESLEKHVAMPHELEDEPGKDTASMVDHNEGFFKLEEMCLRIKAIEEALTKKVAMEELKASARRSRRRSGSLRKQNHEIYPQESEMITKDIVLDQVSDCSSYGISKRDILKIEDDHSFEVHPQSPQTGKSLSEESLVVDKLEISDRYADPNKEVNKRKVLERLHSDLQKLSNLHIAVEDLKSKVEKEERSEKGKEDEYETVKAQIHEAEEALEKLLSVNRKLVTKVVSGFEISDGSKSSVDIDEDERSRRRRISEQARRGSEKIGRLQFEIQRLQHLLLKLEGEREDRVKAKTSSDSKARTLLKDYIYGGVRGERRKRIKKRFAFCGCAKQPPSSP